MLIIMLIIFTVCIIISCIMYSLVSKKNLKIGDHWVQVEENPFEKNVIVQIMDIKNNWVQIKYVDTDVIQEMKIFKFKVIHNKI